jgi:lipid II:glycine glycyltransferase (peptidoglycan interpeptide bridge formation enzyme)
MILYWTVLQYAVREGYKLFDFGRSTVNAGTYRFKKQWGAKPGPLHWHYCLPPGAELPALNPQNAKFRLATKIWQRLPLKVANALGPHIVRNLP